MRNPRQRIGETHRFNLRAEVLHIHKSPVDHCWIVRCTAARCQREVWTQKASSHSWALLLGRTHAKVVHGADI